MFPLKNLARKGLNTGRTEFWEGIEIYLICLDTEMVHEAEKLPPVPPFTNMV